MDLNKYKELTGIDVPTAQQGQFNASVRRARAAIESMLGFSLKPKNLYTEQGKVQFQGHYLPTEDLTNLLPPDSEEGVYKLFPYDERDDYFHVDPFKNVYRVKLVVPTRDGKFITITELDNVVPQYGRDGIGKFVKRHWEWFTWDWYRTWRVAYSREDRGAMQLAVEADWLNCYPDDLMYLWADMIEYQMDPNRNMKSESVDGHSWSKSDASKPETKPENKLLLKRYAGPYGSVVRNPV